MNEMEGEGGIQRLDLKCESQSMMSNSSHEGVLLVHMNRTIHNNLKTSARGRHLLIGANEGSELFLDH